MRRNVARNHFHEEVLQIDGRQKLGTQFIKTVSLEIGLRAGLTDIDKCLGSDEYYALPNQTFSDMEAFVSTKSAQKLAQQQIEGTIVEGTSRRGLS